MSLCKKKTVVVGMSGGVDSSVTALILKQQGYRVIGMFMKNWEEEDEHGQCHSSSEYDDVMRVCDKLEIPHYSVNFVKEYWDDVFTHFLREYEAGHTPNPDILCNREIKFKALLEKAKEYGADYLATGHYVRKGTCLNGESVLLKGLDPGKDQSYFLHAIHGEALNDVLFPIGELRKSEVRKIAAENCLSNAKKKDSMGICFIGKRNFKQFWGQYLKKKSGNFETLDGRIMGQHDGIAYYTIGQRRGMGIGGQGDPWFVVGKDIERNVVYVEQGKMHASMYSDYLIAMEATWISPRGAPKLPFKCKAKVRYRQADQECTVSKIEGDLLFVEFAIPQRAITPRQSVVFYEGEVCLGGAIIKSSGPSYFEQKIPLPRVVSS